MAKQIEFVNGQESIDEQFELENGDLVVVNNELFCLIIPHERVRNFCRFVILSDGVFLYRSWPRSTTLRELSEEINILGIYTHPHSIKKIDRNNFKIYIENLYR